MTYDTLPRASTRLASSSSLAGALQDERNREAALITFLVTLSGVTLIGIGSAFWGVVAGALAMLLQDFRRRPA